MVVDPSGPEAVDCLSEAIRTVGLWMVVGLVGPSRNVGIGMMLVETGGRRPERGAGGGLLAGMGCGH